MQLKVYCTVLVLASLMAVTLAHDPKLRLSLPPGFFDTNAPRLWPGLPEGMSLKPPHEYTDKVSMVMTVIMPGQILSDEDKVISIPAERLTLFPSQELTHIPIHPPQPASAVVARSVTPGAQSLRIIPDPSLDGNIIYYSQTYTIVYQGLEQLDHINVNLYVGGTTGDPVCFKPAVGREGQYRMVMNCIQVPDDQPGQPQPELIVYLSVGDGTPENTLWYTSGLRLVHTQALGFNDYQRPWMYVEGGAPRYGAVNIIRFGGIRSSEFDRQLYAYVLITDPDSDWSKTYFIDIIPDTSEYIRFLWSRGMRSGDGQHRALLEFYILDHSTLKPDPEVDYIPGDYQASVSYKVDNMV